ncbi:MAG: TIGR03557 family F420-dependent LLM class oxidoreductase [Nitrolancea sp.]
MTDIKFGFHLSTEEHPPADLVRYAQQGEASGFDFATMSDHFHPWLDSQGQSPFAWSVLGAVAQATTNLQVGTAVTCPIMRYRPEIIAQAAATTEVMMPGRFFLGLGTGENLNEHITGDHWPRVPQRREMLEEAVDVIRALWSGDLTSHHGKYYTVEDARIYTMPDDAPPIFIAASGPRSAELAGRIGDGLITIAPKPKLLEEFENAGGKGKPSYCQMTMCWAKDMATARKTAYKYWRTSVVPGPLHPNLPLPSDFDAISKLSNEESLAGKIPMGPDPETYVKKIRERIDAGFDHVFLHQIGHEQDGFFEFISREVLPHVRRDLAGAGSARHRAASD